MVESKGIFHCVGIVHIQPTIATWFINPSVCTGKHVDVVSDVNIEKVL